MSLDALIGSLKTHEIELFIEAHENISRKRKIVVLKSPQKTSGQSSTMVAKEEEEEIEDEDENEVAHLVKRMNKLFTKKAKSKKRFLRKKKKET